MNTSKKYVDNKGMLYWLLTIGVIILLSVFGREVQLLLITKIDSIFIAGGVFVLLFGILFILWKKREQYHILKRTLLGTTVFLICGIAAVQLRYLLPAEAVHFLTFSCLGWFSATVFGPLYGAFAVISISVGDEVLQYFLPSRIGDIHDVVINLLSGFIGIILKFRC